MPPSTRWLRRLLRLFGRHRDDHDIKQEMQFHVDMRARELIETGSSPAAARRQARLEFGGMDRFQEEARDARRLPPLEDFLSDLRFAARLLRRSPGFAAVAVLTIGLCIAANTAVFSIVNAVMLRPLPFPQAQRILFIGWDWNGAGNLMGALSPLKFEYWREQNRSFEAVATWRSRTVGVGERGGAGQAALLLVSPDFLRVVGVQPRLGRGFSAAEDAAGGPAVAIITDNTWRGRLGGDPGAIGRSVILDGTSYQVIGVLPPTFAFPLSDKPDVLVPLRLVVDPRDEGLNYEAMARLAPGVTRAAARADVQRITESFRAAYPGVETGQAERADVMDYGQLYLGGLQTTLWVLQGAVLLVLLIACANVANLLLARGTTRQREMAVRATLGAGRGRLARQVMSESLLLAAAGGTLGLALAAAGLRFIVGVAPAGIQRLDEVSVDASVLAFTSVTALITGLLFGLIAAFPAARVNLSRSIREGQRAGTSRRTGLGRAVLVGAEAALAMMLLAGAGLLITSFVKLRRTDLGFDAQQLTTLSFPRLPDAYRSTALTWSFEQQLLERLRSLPGVVAAADASTLPLTRGPNIPMTVEGRPDASEGAVEWRSVSPGYFDVLGIRIVRGRPVTEEDIRNQRPVVVISEALAQKYWPDQDPLGQRILIGVFRGKKVLPGFNDPPREIVGVSADMREAGPARRPLRTMFVPHDVTGEGMPGFLVRVRGSVTADALRQAVQDVDRTMTVPELHSMTERLRANLAQDRFNTLLMGLFAGAALLLTAIGIYGVVSYTVRLRTPEIGVRLALGAQRGRVLRASMMRGMRPVLIGLAVGVGGALGLARFLTSMLHDVRPTDPVALSAVALLLALVALLASWLPSRRAARVDPMVALRFD